MTELPGNSSENPPSEKAWIEAAFRKVDLDELREFETYRRSDERTYLLEAKVNVSLEEAIKEQKVLDSLHRGGGGRA